MTGRVAAPGASRRPGGASQPPLDTVERCMTTRDEGRHPHAQAAAEAAHQGRAGVQQRPRPLHLEPEERPSLRAERRRAEVLLAAAEPEQVLLGQVDASPFEVLRDVLEVLGHLKPRAH